MSGQQRQCPSTMRQLPGRQSRLHGKRHFLERGERTWTAVPSATRGAGETGPLLLCKARRGVHVQIDEVMCCEGMEWQRTSLARNRNADRVGINFFIKEKICLTEMIRNRQTIEAFRANGGKVGGIWEGRPLLLLRPPAPRAVGASPAP